MTIPPANPKICYITHVNNLPGIIRAGGSWSDAKEGLKNNTLTCIMHVVEQERTEKLEAKSLVLLSIRFRWVNRVF